jgi:hypothetical protein
MISYIRDDLQEWANRIFVEVTNDNSEYYWPVSAHYNVFEQVFMKFLNRNLNHFDYKNMVVNALKEEPEWHPGLATTIKFCNFVRETEGKSNSPFGRMCVWKVPPGRAIMPHVDNFVYHGLIERYIFFISSHPENTIQVNVNKKSVRIEKGLLWQFAPAYDRHEFVNNSAEDFYFLGFDVWKPDALQNISKKIDLNEVLENPLRYSGFGGLGTNFKYISQH